MQTATLTPTIGGSVSSTSSTYPPDRTPVVWTGYPNIDASKIGGASYQIRVALLRYRAELGDVRIAAATLTPTIYYVANDDARAVSLEWYDPGADIDATDYSGTVSDTAMAAVPLSSFSVGTSPVLPLSGVEGINANGRFGLRVHVTGGQPTATNGLSLRYTTSPPILALTYYPRTAPEVETALPVGLSMACVVSQPTPSGTPIPASTAKYFPGGGPTWRPPAAGGPAGKFGLITAAKSGSSYYRNVTALRFNTTGLQAAPISAKLTFTGFYSLKPNAYTLKIDWLAWDGVSSAYSQAALSGSAGSVSSSAIGTGKTIIEVPLATPEAINRNGYTSLLLSIETDAPPTAENQIMIDSPTLTVVTNAPGAKEVTSELPVAFAMAEAKGLLVPAAAALPVSFAQDSALDRGKADALSLPVAFAQAEAMDRGKADAAALAVPLAVSLRRTPSPHVVAGVPVYLPTTCRVDIATTQGLSLPVGVAMIAKVSGVAKQTLDLPVGIETTEAVSSIRSKAVAMALDWPIDLDWAWTHPPDVAFSMSVGLRMDTTVTPPPKQLAMGMDIGFDATQALRAEGNKAQVLTLPVGLDIAYASPPRPADLPLPVTLDMTAGIARERPAQAVALAVDFGLSLDAAGVYGDPFGAPIDLAMVLLVTGTPDVASPLDVDMALALSVTKPKATAFDLPIDCAVDDSRGFLVETACDMPIWISMEAGITRPAGVRRALSSLSGLSGLTCP